MNILNEITAQYNHNHPTTYADGKTSVVVENVGEGLHSTFAKIIKLLRADGFDRILCEDYGNAQVFYYGKGFERVSLWMYPAGDTVKIIA
jgi:hypothetical protein